MRTQKLVKNHVLSCLSMVVEELLNRGAIEPYPFVLDEEIMEYWLVTSYLATALRQLGEVVFEDFGSFWWGRTTSGQAIYMDSVISRVCGDC